MKTNTINKQKKLDKLTTEDGFFHILAIDHRDAFKCLIEPQETVTDEVVNREKNLLIDKLCNKASAILIDPDFAQTNPDVFSKGGILLGLEGDNYSTIEFNDNYLCIIIQVHNMQELKKS